MSNSVFDGNVFEGVNEEVTGFPAGVILDNVRLTKAEYFKGVSATSGNAYESIKIHYMRSEGSQKMMQTDQVFALNAEAIKGWDHEVSYEETLKKERIQYFARFKHILGKLEVPEERIQGDLGAVKSFEEFANAFAKLVDEFNTPETRFYLKTNVSKTGYTELSKYPGFLQNMNTGACTLKFSDSERKNNAKYANVDKSKSNTKIEEVADEFDI